MSCQSAPPGSTMPESRSPAKRPPVMPMMRRRPSGVSPSSRAGSSVTSTLMSGCSSSMKAIPQQPEELALRTRRPAFGELAPRALHQGPDLLDFRLREPIGKLDERGIVADQPLAPLLERALLGARRRRAAVHPGERGAHRRRVERAHELADELQLAPPRLVALDALRLAHRGEKLGGQ